MRKCVGGILAVALVMVCAVAWALPIEGEALRIWQEGETVFFQMDISGIEGFPEELELNHKSEQDSVLVHDFGVSFYDGKDLYNAQAAHFKSPKGEAKTGTLEDIQHSLGVLSESGGKYVAGLDFEVDKDAMTWSMALPVKDRDGNEVNIDWENISMVGRVALWNDYSRGYAVQGGEIEAYEVKEDGTLESLGEKYLNWIVYPR